MPLNPNGKKVYSGVIFEVYQWPQKLFDGTTATFEQVKRLDSVTIIAVHDGRIVVTREENPHTKPFLSLPCGFMEKDELPLASAKRELAEEAGLASSDWTLYTTFPIGDKIVWDEHIFIARDCHGVGAQHLDAGERIEVLSYTWEEFLDLPLREDFRLTHLALHLLRLQRDPARLAAFQKLLF
jgi:ADP-ribose pyrophosphatase